MENNKTKEIDIIALTKDIIKNWKSLICFCTIGCTLGLIVAFNTTKIYKSEVILAPELSSGGIGLNENLADIASNFGVEIGKSSSVDALYPELYPDIFSSTDFILSLFNIHIRLKNNIEKTYYEHITKDIKVPFWEKPKLWLNKIFEKKDKSNNKASIKDHFIISKKDNDIYNLIRNSILCNVDKKTSLITISVKDIDPLTAAIVADTLQSRLQQYITNYRTKKARNDVEYYSTLTKKAKLEYEKSRRLYGAYCDANSDIILESVRSKQEDLENDMQIKFNNYNSLNTQLQAAKAKVQERTPAFTIIQKPMMPHKACSTPRSMIVLLFILIGIFADIVWLFLKKKIIIL